MGKPLRVLIVEDSETDTSLIVKELERSGYDPAFERVATPLAMTSALNRQAWDVILSEVSLYHFNMLDALGLLKKKGLDLPFFVVSGKMTENMEPAALKAGAYDCIMKSNLSRLVPGIERACREAEQRAYRARMEGTIRRMIYYDPLTDLPNRTFLHDRLRQVMLAGSREGGKVALLLMDMDRFKEINDTLGHRNGDLLLKQMGKRLQGILGEADTVARLGGDEFGALLGAGDEATVVAQEILKAMEHPFEIGGMALDVGISIGIALFPDHGEEADILFQRADVAMYNAKERDTGYAVYTSEEDRYDPKKLALMGELRHALHHDQLFLLYQPKFHLKTGEISGVEAFVRWRHPTQGIIPPAEFIAMAEKTGLIKPLALWVLDRALCQSRALRESAGEFCLSVNLSSRNLKDTQLAGQIAELLKKYAVPARLLRLEIIESALMEDPGRLQETIATLKKMGVCISIDDFGTGYSSLGVLRRLPVDEIKVDRSFITEMSENESALVIIHSIIDLAHNLKLKVVAEGIESEEIKERLIDLGCDEGQGNHLCPPLTSGELMAWFLKRR